MKMYLAYFKLKFKLGLQYRAAALAGISTQFFFGFVFVSVYIAFYESGSDNLPMKLEELVTYVWLGQAFFSMIYLWYKDKEIINLIKTGNIAYELARPQKIYFMWYAKIYGERLSNLALRFLPVIIVAAIIPGNYRMLLFIPFERLIFFMLAIILSGFLMVSLVLFYHVICLYTIDERGIVNIFMIISDLLSGLTIPVPFFPLFLQKISNILPFQYVSDFPFRLYLGYFDLKTCLFGYLMQLAWIIILMISGYYLTKKALKKVVVQGG